VLSHKKQLLQQHASMQQAQAAGKQQSAPAPAAGPQYKFETSKARPGQGVVSGGSKGFAAAATANPKLASKQAMALSDEDDD
jgi:hypothetical protein